jgi:hypothetical protein
MGLRSSCPFLIAIAITTALFFVARTSSIDPGSITDDEATSVCFLGTLSQSMFFSVA